jgi:hypothetical protein
MAENELPFTLIAPCSTYPSNGLFPALSEDALLIFF